MQSFLANIELWLSAVGIVVILLVPRLLLGRLPNYWATMAVTAAAVGVLHGLIFWFVRRQQRRVRHDAIRSLQSMLKDRINNQLTVILGNVQGDTQRGPDREGLVAIRKAVEEVSALLGTLSEESLRRWQSLYRRF